MTFQWLLRPEAKHRLGDWEESDSQPAMGLTGLSINIGQGSGEGRGEW